MRRETCGERLALVPEMAFFGGFNSLASIVKSDSVEVGKEGFTVPEQASFGEPFGS